MFELIAFMAVAAPVVLTVVVVGTVIKLAFKLLLLPLTLVGFVVKLVLGVVGLVVAIALGVVLLPVLAVVGVLAVVVGIPLLLFAGFFGLLGAAT